MNTRMRRGRALLAGVVASVVTASLLASTPAEAEPSPSEGLRPQAEPLNNHGGEVRGRSWAQKGQPKVDTPKPIWPAAGTARAVVPSTADRRASASGGARAGSLPVWVDRAPGAAGAALSEVTVELRDRASVPAIWRQGLVVRLASAKAAGTATVSVDYSGFRYAYGAGWSERLRLWQVPACGLTDPGRAGCSAKPLASRNQPASGMVSAEVPMATGADTFVALAAGPSGSGGDFTASSLSPSATWSAGGSSGDFSWSYPMRVPPALGGPEPKVALSYSSSSVDGRSAATNNQPSWLGEGFEYSPGFIERRYVPCADDTDGATANNKNNKTGDLCWRSDNATMSLNGSGSELIFQAGKGWHARSEDAAKIEKLTDTTNGDHDGEYWKVTTSDGTQYFFGRHTLPGHTTVTNSAWTVPVYGNDDNEPCHAATFANSDCAKAWRWNLDYVVDTHGNTMSYWYDKELNEYASRLTDTETAQYVRGGYLKRIDYGTWDRGTSDRSLVPVAKVTFEVDHRCLSSCGTHDATRWPDVPWDQECAVGSASCQGKYSPTFWSTKRLAKVTTTVWDPRKQPAAGWQDVDSWTFTHSFPSPGDGSNAGLWLASIVQRGLVGTETVLPPITFEPVAMTNRVLTQTNTTNSWQRLANIVTEAGAKIQVVYSLPECTSGNLPASPETNTKRCYPVITRDPYSPDPDDLITEWWHKYVVKQVSEMDIQLQDNHQAPTKNTFYDYGPSPAWHYADDDGLTRPKFKTWNQFRGYSTVTTTVGDDPALKTLTKTTYLRGMHGDRAAPSGGTRTVTVGASVGSETVYDEDAFAGMVREQVVYNGVESKPVSKTVNVPWQSPATASRQINNDWKHARFTGTQTVYTSTALGVDGAGGWRTKRVRTTFDNTYGTVSTAQDDGDVNVAGDETCVTTTYNRNIDKNIVTLPKRVTKTALPCGTAPATTDDIVSDVRNSYDGASSPDTPPSEGSPSKVEQLSDWTAAGGTVFQTASQSTHDAFGRPKTSTDVRGNTTTTDYTPADAGPLTSKKETNTAPYNWSKTTEMAVYWGAPTKETDANGRITEATYDSLGRVTKVWNPGWARAGHESTPSVEYTYSYSPTRSDYPFVKTRTLNAAGGYRTSYQISDGLLRPRQTQADAVGGGRVVADTVYDAWGRVALAYRAHAESGAPSGVVLWKPEWAVPALNKTLYDRANRPTNDVFLAGDGVSNLVEKWRTTTAYAGDRTMVTPPDGDVPTTTVVDVEGRTVQLRQHTTEAGVGGAYEATSYTYNRKGKLTKITDSGGNEWTYKFDIKGRQIESRDPDKGKTLAEYNAYDDLVKTTDANNEILVYQYDQLGRKTGLYDDTISTATRRVEWRYDALAGGGTVRGQLTHTLRYDGGNVYEAAVSDFTPGYQPLGMVYIIPSGETGLAGAYTFSYGYSQFDESPTTITYPSAAGLGGEQVTTEYNNVSGLPTALKTNLTGVTSYVTGQTYTSYGEPQLTTLKTGTSQNVEELAGYDHATRRVSGVTVKPQSAAGTVSARAYQYDPAGNIESIVDTPQVGQADTQCFRYDGLRRLTSAWSPKAGVDCQTDPSVANLGGPAPYWLDWQIDKLGNRTEETSHAAAGDTVRTYAVPTPGANVVRPHAVTGVTTTAPGQSPATQTFGYDNAGNMTSRPGQTLTWDAEGRLRSVIQGSTTTTNIYDAHGTRLIRRDGTGKTLYLPGMELRYETASTVKTLTRYYGFAGKTVASRTVAGGLAWLLSDHQGTQQITINATTQAVTIRRQTPYGGMRSAVVAWPNQKGFVGGDNDPTGLVQIGARAYDTALGRFISVDPIQDLSDPQQWNGYAYSNNNPTTFSDPTGLCMTDACFGHKRQTDDRDKQVGCGSANACEGPPDPANPKQVLDKPVDVPTDKQKELFKRGYKGSKAFTNRELLEWGSQTTYNWEYICANIYGFGDYWSCKENNPFTCKGISCLHPVLATCGMLPGGEVCDAADFVLSVAEGDATGAALSAGSLVLAALPMPGLAKLSRFERVAPDVGQVAGSCLFKSFSADTRVLMADGSTKPIAEIEVGDEVMAADPETGERGARTVTHVWVHEDELVDLRLEGDRVRTTEDHPFWNDTDREWQLAGDLDPGDRLLTAAGGSVVVGGLAPASRAAGTAYNLTVDGIHTYFVVAGIKPVLVHNTPGPPCRIGADGWPIPTMDNCRACATEIQNLIGGDIVHIKDAYGAPALGPSVRDPAGKWTEHYAVIKDGTVYDGFTGPSGLPLDAYRGQWLHGEYLSFTPVG